MNMMRMINDTLFSPSFIMMLYLWSSRGLERFLKCLMLSLMMFSLFLLWCYTRSDMFGLQVATRLMVLGIDSGNGKWYSFRLERSTFGLIMWAKPKTWLSLLVIIIWPTKSNCLTYPPHKASPLQPNRTLAEYVDVYSPLLYTPNPPRLSALQPLLRRRRSRGRRLPGVPRLRRVLGVG
jgi:hypothetical protein